MKVGDEIVKNVASSSKDFLVEGFPFDVIVKCTGRKSFKKFYFANFGYRVDADDKDCRRILFEVTDRPLDAVHKTICRSSVGMFPSPEWDIEYETLRVIFNMLSSIPTRITVESDNIIDKQILDRLVNRSIPTPYRDDIGRLIQIASKFIGENNNDYDPMLFKGLSYPNAHVEISKCKNIEFISTEKRQLFYEPITVTRAFLCADPFETKRLYPSIYKLVKSVRSKK